MPEHPGVVDCAAGEELVEDGPGLRVEVPRHHARHAAEGATGPGLLGAEPVQLWN